MIVNDRSDGAPSAVPFVREFTVLVERINTHPRWHGDAKARRIAVLAWIWQQAREGACTLYPERACNECDRDNCDQCPNAVPLVGTFSDSIKCISIETGISQSLISAFLRWLRLHGYLRLEQDDYDVSFYVIDYAAIRRNLIDGIEDIEDNVNA